MKHTFTASLCREGNWIVAQCLEIDIANQGESSDEALDNLAEALALHFMPPFPAGIPAVMPCIAASGTNVWTLNLSVVPTGPGETY